MKKSDLPWVLPLLTAWSQGKTLQVKCAISGKWFDYAECDPIKFSGAEGDYRIKSEPKSPLEVYTEVAYPGFSVEGWSPDISAAMAAGLLAVVKAYKAGELELPNDL